MVARAVMAVRVVALAPVDRTAPVVQVAMPEMAVRAVMQTATAAVLDTPVALAVMAAPQVLVELLVVAPARLVAMPTQALLATAARAVTAVPVLSAPPAIPAARAALAILVVLAVLAVTQGRRV